MLEKWLRSFALGRIAEGKNVAHLHSLGEPGHFAAGDQPRPEAKGVRVANFAGHYHLPQDIGAELAAFEDGFARIVFLSRGALAHGTREDALYAEICRTAIDASSASAAAIVRWHHDKGSGTIAHATPGFRHRTEYPVEAGSLVGLWFVFIFAAYTTTMFKDVSTPYVQGLIDTSPRYYLVPLIEVVHNQAIALPRTYQPFDGGELLETTLGALLIDSSERELVLV